MKEIWKICPVCGGIRIFEGYMCDDCKMKKEVDIK